MCGKTLFTSFNIFVCKMMFVWNIFMVEWIFKKKKVPVRSKPNLKGCLFVRCESYQLPISRYLFFFLKGRCNKWSLQLQMVISAIWESIYAALHMAVINNCNSKASHLFRTYLSACPSVIPYKRSHRSFLQISS